MPTARPQSAPRPQSGTPSGTAALGRFWARVTDGLEAQQLWSQFVSDARSGYRLYSREVDTRRAEGQTGFQFFVQMARTVFWAILMKLTPVRRVMLLAALVLLLMPAVNVQFGENVQFRGNSLHLYGELLLLALLLLEIGDRVIMKRDLEIAREIQLWLVPETAPAVPGADLAFVNRPANTVAGDYYDVLPWPGASSEGAPHAYLIAMADVAGKSLPAALLMATLQASLRSLATTTRALPELARALNLYSCDHSRGGERFTTAFLAAYDPAARILKYLNAGHNPPMLRRAAGGMQRLDVGGMPFGILRDTPYESAALTLEPGDRLIVYTDGLTEAVNDREEEFGEQRLVGWLMTSSNTPAADQVRDIVRLLAAFTGTARQNDDMTCLVVRVI